MGVYVGGLVGVLEGMPLLYNGLLGDSVPLCGNMEGGHAGVLSRAHPRHPALGCGIHNASLLGLAMELSLDSTLNAE